MNFNFGGHNVTELEKNAQHVLRKKVLDHAVLALAQKGIVVAIAVGNHRIDP